MLIAIGLPRQRIYLLKQQLNGITRWRGDFHGLSRSAISAIEEFADRSNPGGLAPCLHRQAREFGDSRGACWRASSCTSPRTLCRPPRLKTQEVIEEPNSSSPTTPVQLLLGVSAFRGSLSPEEVALQGRHDHQQQNRPDQHSANDHGCQRSLHLAANAG